MTYTIVPNISLIEEGRQYAEAKERIAQASKEIFTTAIDILKSDSFSVSYWLAPGREGRYRIGNPPGQQTEVTIISSRGNLDKARGVDVEIEGVGSLYISKKGKKGEERFQAKEDIKNSPIFGEKVNLSDTAKRVEDYLAVVKSIHLPKPSK